MSVSRFSHVTIFCTKFDAALDFYREIVGMDVKDRPMPAGYPRSAIGSFEDGSWCIHFFDATDEQRAQFAAMPHSRTGVMKHVSLRAEGYVAQKARLVERGIAFREFTAGDRHLMQFLDLDGMELELTFQPAELPNGPIPWTPGDLARL